MSAAARTGIGTPAKALQAQLQTRPVACWARVVHGLEWIAAAELSAFPSITGLRVDHRNIVFSCSDFGDLLGLRCVDDVYLLWADLPASGLDHTRASLARLEELAARLPHPPAVPPSVATTVRLTVSMLGRRNYSRFDVEKRVGPVLAARLSLPFSGSTHQPAAGATWLRVHLTYDRLLIGIRVGQTPLHRRDWRTEGLPGALHPPVAAAIALLAQLQPGHVVLDPFAGSGTLLIEAGILCRGLKLVGVDIDPGAVAAANIQAGLAGTAFRVASGDAASVPAGLADRLISNPPWGNDVRLAGSCQAPDLAELLLRPLRPNGRAVFLVGRDLQLARQMPPAKLRLCVTLRLSGRLADLIVVDQGALFTQSPMGQALHYALKHYRMPF